MKFNKVDLLKLYKTKWQSNNLIINCVVTNHHYHNNHHHHHRRRHHQFSSKWKSMNPLNFLLMHSTSRTMVGMSEQIILWRFQSLI